MSSTATASEMNNQDHLEEEEDFHFDHNHTDYEGAKLGVWLFLFTELVLFGAMFLALFVYTTGEYGAEFHEAGKSLKVMMGAGNTLVLLTSSLTMVYAITALQKGSKYLTLLWLGLTIALALAFMVVKYFEWTGKFKHHIYPAHLSFMEAKYGPSDLSKVWDKEFKDSGMTLKEFNHVPVTAAGVEMSPEEVKALPEGEYPHHRYTKGQVVFFGMYFAMTGLHGFHVIIGVLLLLWMVFEVAKGTVTSENYGYVENVGLYWHLVDLIWIYLFPLFYLVA